MLIKKQPKTIADLPFKEWSFSANRFSELFQKTNPHLLKYNIAPNVYTIYVNNKYCCCDTPIKIYVYYDNKSICSFLKRVNDMLIATYGDDFFVFKKFVKLTNTSFSMQIEDSGLI
jgi:hypothetical protein